MLIGGVCLRKRFFPLILSLFLFFSSVSPVFAVMNTPPTNYPAIPSNLVPPSAAAVFVKYVEYFDEFWLYVVLDSNYTVLSKYFPNYLQQNSIKTPGYSIKRYKGSPGGSSWTSYSDDIEVDIKNDYFTDATHVEHGRDEVPVAASSTITYGEELIITQNLSIDSINGGVLPYTPPPPYVFFTTHSIPYPIDNNFPGPNYINLNLDLVTFVDVVVNGVLHETLNVSGLNNIAYDITPLLSPSSTLYLYLIPKDSSGNIINTNQAHQSYYSFTTGYTGSNPFDSNRPDRTHYDSGFLGSIEYGLDTLIYYVTYPFQFIGQTFQSLSNWLTDSIVWIQQVSNFLNAIFGFLPLQIRESFVVLVTVIVVFSILGIMRRS